jgi:hypothetical protein
MSKRGAADSVGYGIDSQAMGEHKKGGRPDEDGGDDDDDRYGKVVSGYGIAKADDAVLAARKSAPRGRHF